VLRELESPTVDPERDTRVSDDAVALLEPEGERVWLQLGGNAMSELLRWEEDRAREAGAARICFGT
jgi:hypothetical protein